MVDADTPNGENPPPAAGSELPIPKHRFDEVSAEVRRLRDELSVKDRLYMEDRQRMSAQNQPPPEADNPEEYGLDPQVFQGTKKLAARMAAGMLKQQGKVFEQQIGMLANRVEKAELLATKGSDKVKYMPAIQQKQEDHYRTTGTFLPAEMALELLMSDEKDKEIATLKAKLEKGGQAAAPDQATGVQAPAASAPGTAGTRQIPSGGSAQAAAPAGKSFSELSIEEMEARLEDQFRQGQTA